MTIRKAKEKDLKEILRLLLQVAAVHHRGRPDLFKADARKYTREELKEILADEKRPVFVATEQDSETGEERVLGYAFCILIRHENDNILTDILTLYIDDLCVDEAYRGHHIGRSIYEAVLSFARESGCYNVTLNVWSCNEAAMRFYESCGLKIQKTGMETVLGP